MLNKKTADSSAWAETATAQTNSPLEQIGQADYQEETTQQSTTPKPAKLANYMKNKRNSDARKKITIHYQNDEGEEIAEEMLISKMRTLDKPKNYFTAKPNDKKLAPAYEIFANHVFDVETGELLFNPGEISNTLYITFEEFVDEYLPADFTSAVVQEVMKFTSPKSRQEEIDEIKN
ncbi:MAG: hypothetical protein FWG64_10015 [Firmicutes bacterium]|nr:hypothetical protein [Bacillota bacterium]